MQKLDNQLFQSAQSDRETEPRALIVQVSSPITEKQKHVLVEHGAVIRAYIPNNAFLVSVHSGDITSLASLPFVRWIGEYQPGDKLDRDLTGTSAGMHVRQESASPQSQEFIDIVVHAWSTSTVNDVSHLVTQQGGSVSKLSVLPEECFIRVSTPADLIDDIAGITGVEWIEPYAEAHLCNDVVTSHNGINVKAVRSVLGLTGRNQVIGHADSGIDMGSLSYNHPDLAGQIKIAKAYGRYNDWSDIHGHGTHTAGTLVGTGAAYQDAKFRGIAYEARLVHQSIMDKDYNIGNAIFDLYHLFYSAYINGARIHSDSWGVTTAGGYTWMSKAADRFSWNYKNMLLVFAAGNDSSDNDRNGIINTRTVNAPATAKNVLAVGAAETWRYPGPGGYTGFTWVNLSRYGYPSDPVANDFISYSADGYHRGIAAFSGRGSASDGRIKPDIVAPGTDIISCRSRDPEAGTGWGEFNSYYVYWGGTSMSTPVAAGAAALVRQFLVEHRGISDPSAALIKAVLINGAVTLSPGQYGFGPQREIPSKSPNNVEGWGMVDLEHTLVESVGGRITIHDDDTAGTGNTNAYTVVLDNKKKLSFTLAYTDYPASLAGKIKLVNDLDLVIVTPDAVHHFSADKTQPDRINNIEGLELDAVPPGTTTVYVIGYNVPYGPQPYALVIRDSAYTEPEFDIDYLDYNPWVVRENVPVTVTTHVNVETGLIKKVELFYRRKPEAWSSVEMYNYPQASSGANYTGIIPGQPLNELIEFYVRAESTGGAVDFSGINSYIVNENVLYVSKNKNKPPPFHYTGTVFTNIQEAIYQALDGAVVVVNNGVYKGYMVDITRGITVRSINGPKKTVIDGMKSTPCVTISGKNAVLNGFTIRNGYSAPGLARRNGAGARCFDGAIVKNCIIKNNVSEYHGGGVYLDYGGMVSNCIVKNNTGTYAGGGIYCRRGGIVMNSRITRNRTFTAFGDGAGIFCYYGGLVTNSVIDRNVAGHDGGGVYAIGTATIYGSTICRNKTKNAGAGIYIVDRARVDASIITRNKSKLYAGGVYCGENAFLLNSTISTNKAVRGSGIHCPEGNVFNCHISKNKGLYGGGLELIDAVSTGCVIQFNYAEEGGGVVCELRSMISGAVIRKNKAETGGGLYLYQDSIASNCTIRSNKATKGGGIATGQNSETVHCTIRDNIARQHGGGVYMIPNRNTTSESIVHKSLIIINMAKKNGGGVYTLENAVLRNCIVDGNSASRDGGGVYLKEGGIIDNCVIVKNMAVRGGGSAGMNGGSVNNTILYFNESPNGANVFYNNGGAYAYCCSEPLLPGEGNIDAQPLFTQGSFSYQPADNSPCIDKGKNLDWMYGNTDYNSLTRIINGTVDIGCYEYGTYTDDTPPSIAITSPPDWSVFPAVSNAIPVSGTASDNLGIKSVSRKGIPVKTLHEQDWDDKAVLLPGTNLLRYVATDAFGLSATASIHCILEPEFTRPGIPGVTNFVSLYGGHVWPFTNWVNAATNLQDAVSAAVTGNYILIDSGVYYLADTIVVSQPVTIAGTTIPEDTVLHGQDSHQCLYFIAQDVQLYNVTVAHGKGPFGGGIYSKDGGYIENCIIEDNAASQAGGGVYLFSEGIVTNSVIRNNSSANIAGGIAVRRESLVINSKIEYNTSAGSGGGIVCDSYARIENCSISFNSSDNDGGGLMCNPYVTVIGCTINNNQAKFGGGLKIFEFCLVQNCIITSNTANRYAGIQALYAWIRNCLVSYNEASVDAGGVYLQSGGFLQNCTVVKNKSLETVGGILCDNDSHVRNCIVINNTGLTQNNYKNSGDNVEYYNNCIRPQISGGFNISDDPRFKDPNRSDFHLTSGSPCINKGKSDAWMLLARDLDGTKRIIGNIPDIGVYEYPVSLSVLIDADTTEGTDPLNVAFSSRISGEEPESLWFLWDIDGDGRYDAYGQDYRYVLYTYTNPGMYSVSLSLSNAWGIIASVTRTNMVDVLPEPLLAPIILVVCCIFIRKRQ
jgi:hypothetical protein